MQNAWICSSQGDVHDMVCIPEVSTPRLTYWYLWSWLAPILALIPAGFMVEHLDATWSLSVNRAWTLVYALPIFFAAWYVLTKLVAVKYGHRPKFGKNKK